MKTNKHLKIALLTFFIGCLSVNAQVTIGSEEAPIGGALLQVKDKKGVTDDAENATKGIAFPRVKLTHKSDLQPMLTGGATAAQKKTHVGLVVYNTYDGVAADDATFFFKKGLYTWNNTEWASVGTPGVANGLTLTNTGVVKLGGELTDATTTIDLGAKSLIFDNSGTIPYDPINNPASKNAGFMLKDLEQIGGNTIQLVADIETGRVGVSSVVPATLAFFQSSTELFLSQLTAAGASNGDTENKDNTFIILWAMADEMANVIVDLKADGIFEVRYLKDTSGNPTISQDLQLELSGYMGYVANANTTGDGALNNPDSNNSSTTIVNAAIQVKRLGEPQFTNWTAMRGVYANNITAYRQTLSIPPAIAKLESGDQIRMVVIASPNKLGALHNRGKVVKPFGTNIAKAIKIIAQ